MAFGDLLEPVPEAVPEIASRDGLVPQLLDLRGEPLHTAERHLKA